MTTLGESFQILRDANRAIFETKTNEQLIMLALSMILMAMERNMTITDRVFYQTLSAVLDERIKSK